MAMMRHTDPNLTLRTYNDMRIFDLHGSVEKLALPAVTQTEASAQTGTDGAPAGDSSGWCKSGTTESALIGSRPASTGTRDESGRETQVPLIGRDRQQKTPP